MRVVVQRVTRAAVRRLAGDPPVPVAEAAIGPGLVALAGFRPAETDAALEWMAAKLPALRLFPDAAGVMNRSLEEAGGALLVVPNFTLYGDAERGRRPSWSGAASPAEAEQRFEAFLACLRRGPVPVAAGWFQAHMHVELVNDGPVTLLLERD